MGLSLSLVMAACLAGQTPPAAPCAGCGTAPDCCVTEQGGLLVRLRERMQQFFHRSSEGTACCGSACAGYVTPGQTGSPPVALNAPAPKELPVLPVTHTESKPSEIKPAYLPKLGHAEDYSWVTGQLFYVHAGGEGIWLLRYAPLDREDRYGGGMVLAAAVSLSKFREGDLISIHGEVLNEGRASKYLGGPLYRVNSTELIERGQ